MAEDAIRCFLERARETGEPICEDVEPATEHLAVTVPQGRTGRAAKLPVLQANEVVRAILRAGLYIHHPT